MKRTIFSALVLALFLLSCGDSSVNINGSDDDDSGGGGSNNNGSATKQTANSIIITLRYWETKEKDGLLNTDKDLDPKIYFNVIARQGGKIVSNNSTSALLDKDNVGQSWSGSSKSSPIPFTPSADELRIEAIVVEKDPLVNDDISPGYYKSFGSPFTLGNGTVTLDYGSGKSKVSFDYEFVWR
ncbi:hypothetical protein R83H12_02065 [Fibrobacteria bacterium R8-3-H12]